MNERLNQQNLIDLLVKKHGIDKKDAEKFIKVFFLLIEKSLETDKIVKIKGLGSFKLIDVENRESVNINTGERFLIEGYTKLSFIPDSSLREVINRPFEHFETVLLNSDKLLEDTIIDNEDAEEANWGISKSELQNQSSDQGNIIEKESISSCTNESKVSHIDLLIEQKKTKNNVQNHSTENRKSNKTSYGYLVAIIITIVILCGGAVLFIYYPDLNLSDNSKNFSKNNILPTGKQAIELVDQNKEQESISIVEIESEKKLVKQDSIIEVNENVTSNNIENNSDTARYIIKGTKLIYTLKEGETLRLVALKFYGTKALWSYILKYNSDVIKDPDKVPHGIKLKIPELVKREF